ncbi:NAD-binding protein [Lipingzhangella sp. LS1_29]|uniref:NAD-binding protein n=1 Tax=Lipingzhangella rawalii TaxID=2055835 RepID=A0ABU2HA90_9ACTN|nr:NAD-binding protein [Lipingzhangella rawalii]MDS1272217.1 NAD-binding protein [Lipingzhangella rawalii]
MRLLLSRAWSRLWQRATWALPVELLAFVFVSSWLLMVWAEPPGAAVVQPDVYWWWFAGTITPAAAGPGDHYPVTTGGYLVGVYVIVGGIVTITMIFARLARAIDKAKERRMHGRAEARATGHIAVLGYTPGRTERIVEALTAEEPHEIVVCAWDEQAQQHPLSHRDDTHFVRGNLTEDEVLARAALPRAAAVLVDPRDDDEALKVVVAAAHTGPDVHTVVALHDPAHARTVSRIAPGARCVAWHACEEIAAEVRDPGMSALYTAMLSPGGRATYSIRVPASLAGRSYGHFQMALGRWNAATILGIDREGQLQLSPSWNEDVPVGATLYYLARRRLSTADLERYVDRAERTLVFDDRELLRSEWH